MLLIKYRLLIGWVRRAVFLWKFLMVYMMGQHIQKWVYLLPVLRSGLCLVLHTITFPVSVSGADKVWTLPDKGCWTFWGCLKAAEENPGEVREAFTPSNSWVWPSYLGSCYFIWASPTVEEQLLVVALQVTIFYSKTSLLSTQKWWFLLPCSFWMLHTFLVTWLWQD